MTNEALDEELREVIIPVIGACLLMRSDDPQLIDKRIGVAAEVANAVVKFLARRTPETTPEADVVERNSDYNLGFEDGLAVGSLKQEAAPDVVGLLREARMRLGKYWDAVDIMQDGPDDSDVAMAEGRLAEGHKGCRALLARIDAALESGRE